MGSEGTIGRLGDYLERVIDNRGKTPPNDTKRTSFELLEVNCLTGSGRRPNYEVVRKFVTKEAYDSWFRNGHPKTNDVIISTVGSIGEVCISEGRGSIAQNLIALSPKPDALTGEFLYYYLCSPEVKNELLTLNISSVQPSIKVPHLLDLEISLLPLPEQKAIAHILGSLDDKIELNRRMNATLEGMAQALFKSWFVDFEPVIDNALAAGNPIPEELAPRAEVRRQALADGTANREATQAFPAAFKETESMGWIPEGWEIVAFEDLVAAKQGRYLAKTEMVNEPDEDHKYPVWGGNGILGYGPKSAYDRPITLMTCRGSNCGMIKSTKSSAWVSNNSFACPTKFGSEYFLYLYFQNENFSECISGSAQPQITYTALKNKVMKYPISKEICETFSESVQVYIGKIALNEKQNEVLTKLRDTLLPKLISGELRIPEAEQLTEEALV